MLAISVGPIIFSIIKQSINNGHKGGFTFVAGVSASDITLVLVSQLFTELFRYLLEYKKTIGIGGSILLIGIGIYVLFFKKVSINEAIEIVRRYGDKESPAFVNGILDEIEACAKTELSSEE